MSGTECLTYAIEINSMNLGDIYLKTALLILAGALLLPLVAVVILHAFKKWSWGLLISASLLLSCMLVVVGLETLHQPIFIALHQWQNPIVPKSGCVRYEPSFTRLYAVYQMSQPKFEQWVASCPWKLMPQDLNTGGIIADRQYFGLSSPSAIYATDPAPNGKNLTVYYEGGMMYLAYYSM